jgi:KUP system potassium uptake protein
MSIMAEVATAGAVKTASKEQAAHGPGQPFSFVLALVALGIVFGDIGTSPLYAFNEVFNGHGVHPTRLPVLGALSLIFWGLMLPITLKYVGLALRISADGEGGVFALYKIIREMDRKSHRMSILGALLVFGAGLLYADGVITPAISVSSAIEGLGAVKPIFFKWSEPITIVILTLLFLVQRRGTAAVGSFFGWVMIVWFLSIGALGLREIVHEPRVVQALNPMFALEFVAHLSILQRFIVLGYVMLAYTGGEALYADLGHVGAPAIQVCWLSLVYPCLMLNYLGQGSYLLHGGQFSADTSLFYLIVPHPLILPMVILGALATVIASQALITGANSLTAMAAGLNLMPRIRIMHTNAEHKGQIYLPFLNALLWIACTAIVLYFKKSSAMANAYGLAVAGVMFISSLALMVAAPAKLGWTKLVSRIIFGAFALFDLCMLIANTFKIIEGGFVPVFIGIVLFLMMMIWKRGRKLLGKLETRVETIPLHEYLARLKKMPSANYVQVYMTGREYTDLDMPIPPSLNDSISNPGYGSVTAPPSDVIFLFLRTEEDRANVPEEERFTGNFVTGRGFEPIPTINMGGCPLPHHREAVHGKRRSNVYMIVIHYGYMESPDLAHELHKLRFRLGIDAPPSEWGRFADRLSMEPGSDLKWWQTALLLIFSQMRRWTSPLYDQYGLSKIGTVHGVRLLCPMSRQDM